MSIISISLDTKSRQVALTVDGVIVPADEVSLYKYMAYDGEGYDVGFSYTEKRTGQNGFVETHSFRLPPPQVEDADANAVANQHGLVEEVGDQGVARQIANFLKEALKDKPGDC